MTHTRFRPVLTKQKSERLAVCMICLSAICVPALGADPGPPVQKEAEADRDPSEPVAGGEDTAEIESIEDIDLLELEIPTVVTAARRKQRITTVPQAISVITAKDIRRSGARSIADALRLVPGVDVADLAYGVAAVSPRGAHGLLSRTVLVLIDGRQIFDSFMGGTLWGSWPVQLENIERIEVIRGPGGVTWGANAVNGVINIVTKDPADQLGVTATAGGGSRGSHKEHLGYSVRDGKLRMRISGEFEGSDGFREGGSILRGLSDYYETGHLNVHAIYEHGPKDTVTVSAGSALVDGGTPPPPLAGIGLTRDTESLASFLLAKLKHQIEKDNAIELTGFVNDFSGSPGVPAIDYRYDQFALQLGHTFKPSDTHTITWGIDNRVDILDTSNSDPYCLKENFIATDTIGLYVQDEWRFAPKWTLNLGGRIDYEFYGGFQPSARGALSYELTDESLVYGAVSRAFQMPPPTLRFLDMPMMNGLVHVTGDRETDVEALVAYELGYRSRLFERLDTNVNLFWHEFADVTTISPRLGPPGLLRMHNDNRADASAYGLELDAKYALTEDLALLGNYTFQVMDWRSDRPYHERDLIYPPSHKFMVGARYALTDDLHLSSHLYYVDATKAPNPANPFVPRHVDPYFRLDCRAEYEFWKDRASVAVGARNLLDSGHYEGSTQFANDAEVPRMVYVELRITTR